MAHSQEHILSRVPDRTNEYVQSYFRSRENVSFRLVTRVNDAVPAALLPGLPLSSPAVLLAPLSPHHCER